MLHPPVNDNKMKRIVFRNDDVSFDTDLKRFMAFVTAFHRAGFIQLHGVTCYGLCNYSLVHEGEPWIYETIDRKEYHDYEKCVEASERFFIGDNERLIRFLNSIPDSIALHGLYHSDYSRMSYEQQDKDIYEGLKILNVLFPNKKIDTFIAPFNKTNEYTFQVCKKYGLRVSALEGEHLEDRIDNDKGPLYEGEIYRFHHHRFYPESTFSEYELSINILEEYLRKYSYTYNSKTQRFFASTEFLQACGLNYEHHICKKMLKIERSIELNIMRYVSMDAVILQVYSKYGTLLENLWNDGYNHLIGIELDPQKRNIAKKIAKLMDHKIEYADSMETISEYKHGVNCFIISDWDHKILDYYGILDKCVRIQEGVGYYFIVGLKDQEYDLIDIAGKFNAMYIGNESFDMDTQKTLFIFRRNKPKICLYCDKRNWAHDHSAQELKMLLSNEFQIDIKYVVDNELMDVDYFDAFIVFWWGEKSYKWKKYSKSRIIKQVSSHRWQFDKPYGPISVEEFRNTYLDDAYTIICPSLIMYQQLEDVCKNLFLCGKGYSPDKFKYLSKREGEISFCMVGNIEDPVKGVKDILIPSCQGYKLDISGNMRHEDLCEFYNEHDVYVVSSLHEGDPLPLIESMACGCFPISTCVGIAPELIRHKENGYLVEKRSVEEFKKAVEWCKDNIEYIRRMALPISKEIYDNRRWERMVEGYREMLRNHIGRR